MHRPWLLYGAYGYTGRLIARLAIQRGVSPVIAGRNPERTRALAEDLGLEWRAFALDGQASVLEGLEGMAAVLHVAGPFSHTFRAMVGGCLEASCHYLDVTGEIGVFEALHGMDALARDAGIVLLPGVGFDVVPTDCAAARVAARIENPTHLDIAFRASGSMSRGTTKTMIEGMTRDGYVRRDGKITSVPHGSLSRRIPFSDRERDAVCIPWGDVSTAFYSTGIPNIVVYQPGAARQLRWIKAARPLLSASPVQRLLKWYVDRTVDGPDQRQLESGMAHVWCEARNEEGQTASVEVTTPNGYALTADSALTAVQALLAEDYEGPQAGALTPSLAFGDDFVDRLDGVTWIQG